MRLKKTIIVRQFSTILWAQRAVILFSTSALALVCPNLATPTAAHAKQGIPVAAIFSLTGSAAEANKSSLLGIQWAVEEINTAGGVLGRPLQIIEIDDRSTPIGAKVAAEKADKIQVAAIIGPAFSSQALAVARVAQNKSIPMISNVATNPKLTHIGNFIFRICYNDDQQGRVLSRFAYQELNYRKVQTIVNISSDYSLGLADTFEKAFIKFGGTTFTRSTYKARQSNFRQVIEQAKRTNPDAIFIAGHYESARIILEAERSGLRSVPLGGDGWDEPNFYQIGGNQIKLGYYTTHWSESIATAPSKRFVNRYRKGNIILAPTALAYDAAKLLADAIARAGSTDRAAVRDALAGTKGFAGVTGELSFDAHGDPIKSIIIMQIVNGNPQILKLVHPD